MRDPIHTVSASPPSHSPYPVSIRNYKKKDYDYLSNFSRTSLSGTRSGDVARLQERSDCESDLFMTSSSVGYATSVTSSSSTSSTQSFAKNLVTAMEAEGNLQHHHHHKQQQQPQQPPHQHDVMSTEEHTGSPRISMGVEMKDDKADDRLSVDAKDDKLNITDDALSPVKTASGAQVKVTSRSESKPKPKADSAPAVLPKFGSWDTRNPSSGDAYTLIFRRLRDEKQAGGLPVCTSPTHVNEEGPEEPLSQESKKPKEPLHPKPPVQKDSARQKAKGKRHQEARKNATVWNLCCKASVVDD